MRSIITFIISAICLASLSIADPQVEPKAELKEEVKEPQKRTCRIIFPERLNDSPKFAQLFDGRISQKVDLPTMNFSPEISIAVGEITLFMTAEPVTDLKKLATTTPKLIIPEDVKDFYIVVSPDIENPTLPVKMELIILKDDEYKLGETLWINKTKHQIAANLGESKMSVAPESQSISKNPMENSGYYRAEFTYQINAEGDFKKITEQQWWHDKKSRHLAFVVETDRLPKIFIFRDFRGE